MRPAVLRGHDVRVVERDLPGVAEQIHAALDRRLARDAQR